MGVPAFFRWLSKKYPSIVVHCVEEKPKEVNGVNVPVDTSQTNPNDTEFDNLYLDMNGIIHPCTHPEDKPAPKNEEEMMVAIFEYIDRIFSCVRPRKLLYMAIDGVAPRAKMNQQRSRRFRAAQESQEKTRDIANIREELRLKGATLPPEKEKGEHFDSNCITPGTPFMFRLADCLRYYVHDRLNNDPGWHGIKVILSDANVPGEGEHKIMDYIRKQRGQPDHDPNTHHCLCGADADLIMLGLATHEPNFTIIREEFKPNQPRPCDLCAQLGHEMKDCQGLPKEKSGEFDEAPKPVVLAEQEFIFLRINVLREYLTKELQMTNLPFKQDIERAIDDWVFMCFFVGNDFLPHLPSLSIREGAIDRLIKLYKRCVHKTGGYLTDSGYVNLERVQLVMSDLGEVEDEIFKKRRQDDLGFRRRNKEKRHRERAMKAAQRPSFMLGGQYEPKAPGGAGGAGAVSNPRQTAYSQRVQNMQGGNHDAAAALRSMLTTDEKSGQKRKHGDDDSDPEPEDEVMLWEDGWKDRYYSSKFDVGTDDMDFRHTVANEYVLGLCWVLRYYYQGCASWKWYFPYHYAPFASDFVNIGDLNTEFETDTQPFKPLEQLMAVFPAHSKKFLPPTWQELMYQPESPIIDFYPTSFKIDLNGKKYAWQGVALLPFVEESRLKETLAEVYPDLTHAEIARNIRGPDRLFVGKRNPAHAFLEGLYEGEPINDPVEVDTKTTGGMGGTVWCDKHVVLTGKTFESPLKSQPSLENNQAICVSFSDPKFELGFIFKAKLLDGAKLPEPSLKPEDFEKNHRGEYRPKLGFQRGSGYRGRGQKDMGPAMRHISGALFPGPSGRNGNSHQQPGYSGYSNHGYDNQGPSGYDMQGYSGGGLGPQGGRGGYNKYDNQGGGGGGHSRNFYGQGQWGGNQGGGRDRHGGVGGGYGGGGRGGGGGGGYGRDNYGGGGYGGGGGGYGGGGGNYGNSGYNQGGYSQGGGGGGGYGQGGYGGGRGGGRGGGGGYGNIESYSTSSQGRNRDRRDNRDGYQGQQKRQRFSY